MGKRGRAANEAELEPLAAGWFALLLVGAAIVTMALVALWFQLDVNRVFDVPKALALKFGGAGAFLIWLLYALFGRGFRFSSFLLFAGPVFALTGAVVVSTMLSIDLPTSVYGVYERQFGLQGFLGCIGLFAITSTCIGSRRGAVAALAALAIVGGIVGLYATLQAYGVDPYGFFRKPHTKVYSTLGNATFAGNALALIAPVSTLLAIVGATTTLSPKRWDDKRLIGYVAFGVGALITIGLPLWIGATAGSGSGGGTAAAERLFKAGVGITLALLVGCGLVGSWGPDFFRAKTDRTKAIADALGAGGLAAMTLFIYAGLAFTRTRGAWVGTGVAIVSGLILLPNLWSDAPERKRTVQIGCYSLLALLVVGLSVFLSSSNHLVAKTIKSIPAAFDPSRSDYGKGQGTRRYLWTESPRTLLNHRDTLTRIYEDHDDYAEKVTPVILGEVSGIPVKDRLTESEKSSDTAWRTAAVWMFGIGVETYRYAFMSHKSKRLEALDPMTNHDNPHNNYLFVFSSFGIVGLAAYLWLLWRLLWQAFIRFAGRPHGERPPYSRPERAIIFGVVTSFFSYSVYSIAGFDSVACSVFFYFLLGTAAVFFDPASGEPEARLADAIRAHIARLRKRTIPASPAPVWMSIVLALLGLALLGNAAYGGLRVYRAEQAFVGDRGRATTMMAHIDRKVSSIKSAIRINPYESFYKQNLGNTYSDGAGQLRKEARDLQQRGQTQTAMERLELAAKYTDRAEVALYAALDHAWAPENIFISLFQVYYADGRRDLAEHALERALEHSPHLGAVRANLAILELERGAWDEAIADCEWVLEVDRKSAAALRTCGRAYFMKDDLARAEHYLTRAKAAAKKDQVVDQYIADLMAKKNAKTSTRSG